MPQNGEDHFIKEKIKEKPKDNTKFLKKGLGTIGYAALFGFVACLVFCGMRPHVEQWFEPKPENINIPKDTAEDTHADFEQISADDTSDGEAKSKKEKKTIYITEKKSMTVEDYQVLQNQIYQVGRSMNPSLATVTGITDGTDIFDTEYESTGQSCGIIIGKNNAELLILTEYHVIKDFSELQVTFSNNEAVGAKIKAYDANTGIAVLKVKISKLSESTMKYVKVAELGNSLSCRQGEIVIAIGSPLGTNYSILTGNLTSVTNSIAMEDADYTIFTTDMVTNNKGIGALVNTDKEIIGVFLSGETLQKDNTLTAISISELKGLIENLSNGKATPYAGIRGSTVTDAISEEYGLPKGVYIKQVTLGSPAMDAGLQNGDVITEINSQEIASMDEFETELLKHRPEGKINITVKRQNGQSYKKNACTVLLGRL